jgi:uncharacterized oxidoreductase
MDDVILRSEASVKLSSHTVLITGGATGIGLALAERFLAAGSRVLVCGRREDALRRARDRHPALVTRTADLADPASREALAAWAVAEHPDLDVLVNNAGIQRYPRFTEPEPWEATVGELRINLEAPIHLSALLVPHLRARAAPAIVNITSGLAFVPLAHAPVYSATKAALHSFTLTLRHQLRETPIEVVEIIPPAVDTDLGGPGLHTFGVKVDELMDQVLPRVEAGEVEVAHQWADQSRRASFDDRAVIFARMNEGRR